MYQVKILHANQLDIVEDLINMWLRENTAVNVVDIKFQNTLRENNEVEYIAIMIYQQQ